MKLAPETAKLLTAFGLGSKATEDLVIMDVNLPTFPAGSIVLLNGSSGSGKSSLLPHVLDRFDKPSRLCHWKPDPARPVIEQWPLTPAEATNRLNLVGLADPFTWARLPGELSEGQQSRLEICGHCFSEGDVIVIDEFLAKLDRITAKAVTWSVQKMLRTVGIGLIAATAHDDLADHLCPDCHITCDWTPDPQIFWPRSTPSHAPLLDDLIYEQGTLKDWKALKHLHYAAGDPATVHSVHVLRHPNIKGPAAVVVYSYPDLHSAARNLATDDSYRISGDPAVARRLNREVLRLSRIVVTPELRCCGLARRLILESVGTLRVKYIECTTAMAKYSPFLENAGFKEVPQCTAPMEAELMDWADRVQLPDHIALDPKLYFDWLQTQSVRNARLARRLVWQYYHHFVLHRRTRSKRPKVIPGPNDPRWLEAANVALRRIRERPAYFILGPLETTQ